MSSGERRKALVEITAGKPPAKRLLYSESSG
jgi:hypothetical protein